MKKFTETPEGLLGSSEPGEEERRRWEEDTFHLKKYDADAPRWGRIPYWTADEATALLMGKAPEEVKLSWVEDHEGQYKFADEYIQLHEQIVEAQSADVLLDPVPPRSLLAWAQYHSIDVPEDLRAAVDANEIDISELQAERDRLAETCRKLEQELGRARYEADCWRTARLDKQKNMPDTGRDLAERERESLYKIIIGMAIKGYAHNPFDRHKTSKKSKEIAGDLMVLGIPVNDDTVRKYLAQAQHLIPADERESLANPNSVIGKPNSSQT